MFPPLLPAYLLASAATLFHYCILADHGNLALSTLSRFLGARTERALVRPDLSRQRSLPFKGNLSCLASRWRRLHAGIFHLLDNPPLRRPLRVCSTSTSTLFWGGGERFCLRIAPSRLSHPFNSARHFPVTRRPRVHTTSVDPNQAS